MTDPPTPPEVDLIDRLKDLSCVLLDKNCGEEWRTAHDAVYELFQLRTRIAELEQQFGDEIRLHSLATHRITELEANDQRLLRIESMVCQLVNHFRNAAG